MLLRSITRLIARTLGVLVLGLLFFTQPLVHAERVTLAWDPTDPAPDGYRLYQRVEGETYDYSQAAWSGTDASGMIDGLASGTNYYFVVRAYVGDVESADSNEVLFNAPSTVLPTYTIVSAAGNNGGISPEGSVAVDEGATQSYQITPDTGYHVENVVVDGVSMGALSAYEFSNIDADHTITASFAVDTYTISAVAGDNGSISPSGIISVNHGGGQTFAFAPDTGYHVSDVTIDGLSKGPLTSYTFTQVTANRSIEVTFSTDTYTIPDTTQATLAWDPTDPAPDGYRLYQRQEGQEYDYTQPCWSGTETTATIYNLEWDTTYHFVVRAFVGDVESADSNEVVFSATSPTPATHTISVTAGSNGTVSPDGIVSVESGADQTFTISADTGCHVAEVSVDGVSVGAVSSYTFSQVAANHSLDVSFAVNTYTIAATSGANGSISPSGTTTVNHDGNVTYTITADTGYFVADVLVDGVSYGALSTYTFNQVARNHTISATFAASTYDITASAGSNGSISPSGTTTVNHGENLSYTITADAGYSVADVLVDGVSVGAVSGYTFSQISGGHTISATFVVKTYDITATAGINGAISPAGTTTVAHGGSQSYTITASSGYLVADVQVDGASIGPVASYTFVSVVAPHAIHATFEAKVHTIATNTDDNGVMEPSGNVVVANGEDQTFIFTASSGFHIEDIQVDGQSIGGVQEYTFTNVTEDHSISVTFSENTLVNVWIEAEDGDLQWPMEIADDTSASAGGYVWVPQGTGVISTPSEDNGYAQFYFEVPENGTYAIWGSEVSNDTASDSFFVAVDDQPYLTWHTKLGGEETWTWDVVSQRDVENLQYTIAPKTYWLSAGSHTLTIMQREDGTKLDRILVTNDLTITDPEPKSIADSMEFGVAQVDHTWKRVSFGKSFTKPVVVAGPISLVDKDPAVVRIRNVDETGFEICVQEWDYLDGVHQTETVNYLVMEEGVYVLDDGTRIEAGTIAGTNAFQTVAFTDAFAVPPIVISSISTVNDPVAVTGRVNDITINGFDYAMQEQEANTQDHLDETVSYIAWEPSVGSLGGMKYVVQKTVDAVTHRIFSIQAGDEFAAAPVFLSDMQTFDGQETANVRYYSMRTSSFDVLIDEEQSRDRETNHPKEVVGYILFGE